MLCVCVANLNGLCACRLQVFPTREISTRNPTIYAILDILKRENPFLNAVFPFPPKQQRVCRCRVFSSPFECRTLSGSCSWNKGFLLLTGGVCAVCGFSVRGEKEGQEKRWWWELQQGTAAAAAATHYSPHNARHTLALHTAHAQRLSCTFVAPKADRQSLTTVLVLKRFHRLSFALSVCVCV